MKSNGKVVTACIELPRGYDVKKIDVSTVKLNEIVPALVKPTEVKRFQLAEIAHILYFRHKRPTIYPAKGGLD